MKNRCLLICCFIYSGLVFGQKADTLAILSNVSNKFKTLRNFRYEYTQSAHFPNGQKDSLTGEFYMDNDNMVVFNDCDAFTMFYTSHWFYNANHRKKEVKAVNLDKEYSKKLKKENEVSLFQNNQLAKFMDSVVLKNAKISSYERSRDTMKIVLKFSQSQTIQEINLMFDEKLDMPISYYLIMMAPFQQTPKGIQSTKVTMKCWNFNKIGIGKKYSEDDYFVTNKGKIELKKYNKYKLIAKK